MVILGMHSCGLGKAKEKTDATDSDRVLKTNALDRPPSVHDTCLQEPLHVNFRYLACHVEASYPPFAKTSEPVYFWTFLVLTQETKTARV